MPKEAQGLIQPWHKAALMNGRTPLPDAPGVRPWDSMKTRPRRSTGTTPRKNPTKGSTLQERTPLRQYTFANERSASLAHKQWSKADIQLLHRLRSEQIPWKEMALYFPYRSIDGMKQAWHKHRASICDPDDGLDGRVTRKKKVSYALSVSENEDEEMIDAD